MRHHFLAQAVDQSFAQDLAAKAGGAVTISDGKSALLSAGNEAEQANLKVAIGREQQPLVEGDHNIDCRIEGFGGMRLKSEFVKKS